LLLLLVFVVKVLQKVLSCLLLLWILSWAYRWSNLFIDDIIRKDIGFKRRYLLSKFNSWLTVSPIIQIHGISLWFIQMTNQGMWPLFHFVDDILIRLLITLIWSMRFRLVRHQAIRHRLAIELLVKWILALNYFIFLTTNLVAVAFNSLVYIYLGYLKRFLRQWNRVFIFRIHTLWDTIFGFSNVLDWLGHLQLVLLGVRWHLIVLALEVLLLKFFFIYSKEFLFHLMMIILATILYGFWPKHHDLFVEVVHASMAISCALVVK
jgi:hypothetical protein